MKCEAMIYGLATAFVLGSSLLATAQASPPGEHHVHRVATHHHAGRPGTCGENMYWGSKEHHCVDAREKSKGGWNPF